MRLSLRFRVLASLILVVLIAVGVVAMFASRGTAAQLRRYEQYGGLLRQRRFEVLLSGYYVRYGTWADVQPLVEQMGQISGARVILGDPRGRVVADSAAGLVGQRIGEDWHGPSAVILLHGRPVGAVYVSPLEESPLKEMEAFLSAANRNLLWGVLIGGLAAALLAFALSRRILGPVETLTAAARQIAEGDLTQRVAVQSRDEIGELAQAFNDMAGGLSRLETLRRNMVTDVAHELRTPLSSIRGYLEAFRDGVMKPEPEIIESLYEEAMLLNRLIEDLQDLSLAEAGQLRLDRRPAAIANVVARAIHAARAQAATKGITLRTDMASDLPLVDIDAGRIEQILGNLLSNALIYTPSSGEIVIAARTRDGQVEVSVIDTGEGIPHEHLPYVFERFYRTDRSRSRHTGGAGLGLAIVKQLVTAHGGWITAESEVGQGSCFTFALPVADTEVAPVGSSLFHHQGEGQYEK